MTATAVSATGVIDDSLDVVELRITKRALSNLIEWWNAAEVRNDVGGIVTLDAEVWGDRQVKLVGSVHYRTGGTA